MKSLDSYLAPLDYAAVPLRRGLTGHLQLDGAINGVAASFYLDTGAGKTVLDLAQARRRDLCLTEVDRGASGLGTARMAAYRTVVGRLALHTTEETDLAVSVIDLSHVNQALLARGALLMDGVIGGDILEAREAIIDCKRLQLYLRRARPQPAA